MVGRVFRRGFEVWRNPAFLLPGLLLFAAGAIVTHVLAPDVATLSLSAVALRFLAMVGVFLALGWPAATLLALAIALLRGEEASFGRCWVSLGLFIRLTLVELVVSLVVVLGLLLFLAPGLYATVVWSQVRPSIVDGRASFFDALDKSLDLTRGSRGELFAVMLCGGALLLLSFGCASAVRLLLGAAPDSWTMALLQMLLTSPVTALLSAVGAAVYLELVAAGAPLTQSSYFLAPANSPS